MAPLQKNSKARKSATRKRRTQSERSSEMQGRLIQAAISSLAELGYSATSTQVVADRAAVTRGAMTHHFPTKVDLMIAVVEYVFEQDLQYYAYGLKRLPMGEDRVMGIGDLAWDAISAPGGLAVLHIIMAMPGDPALRERLPAAFEKVNHEARMSARELWKTIGVTDHRLVDAATLLNVATFRGLTIQILRGASKREIGDSLRLFREARLHLMEIFVLKTSKSPRRSHGNPAKLGERAPQ